MTTTTQEPTMTDHAEQYKYVDAVYDWLEARGVDADRLVDRGVEVTKIAFAAFEVGLNVREASAQVLLEAARTI